MSHIAADYGLSAYFRDPAVVFVNLYTPSSLQWMQQGAPVSLSQSGGFPRSEEVAFTLRASGSREFSLRLRIPEWADKGARVRVNSEAVQTFAPGRWAELRRTWRNGDHVELELPMSNRLVPVDAQHPDVVALMHGPLVLFSTGENPQPFTRAGLLQASGATFKPFTELAKNEPYSTYVKVQA